jgi:ATP-dependent Clp protease ATP-binding subunit ClpX
MPQDLIKFGLIPEFVGRVPVCVALDALDEEALMKILVEPKNAITKQYKKLFEIDGVELEFDDGAIEEVAKMSFKRKIGARGLRSIMEASMMDTMFEIPSDSNIVKCIITRDVILGKEKPKLVRAEDGIVRKPSIRRSSKKSKGEIA